MRWAWAGERALLVRFPGELIGASARATSLWERLRERGFDEIEDIVPGARTVLITLRPGAEVPDALGAVIDGAPSERAPAHGAHHEIPVVYDGEDLTDVARATGMTPDDVVALHSGATYRVAFVSFSPGFPYLVGLPPALHVPRLATPRTKVPRGAIAIAGPFAGVYPRATPGGWQLLGTARGARLFDASVDPPALLRPGDTVSFVASNERPHHDDTPPRANAPRGGHARVVVERAGPLTTIQDGGRVGYGSSGVPPSGAFDADAAAIANMLAGNDARAALLEATLTGPALSFTDDTLLAIAGARSDATLGGAPVPHATTILARAGERLDAGRARDGARIYVAVGGGLGVEAVLGSASRHVASGLGPEPLRDGDGLDVRPSVVARFLRARYTAPRAVVRVIPGPQWELFDDEAHASFTSAGFVVSRASDRTGVRIEGPALRASTVEIEPEGTPLGSIQVTPDGRAVILGPDRPITGGYPKIAVVIEADMTAIAQARPGDSLRFECVTAHDARAIWREHRRALRAGIVEA